MQYLSRTARFPSNLTGESQKLAVDLTCQAWGKFIIEQVRSRLGCTFEPPMWCAFAMTSSVSDYGELTLELSAIVDIPEADLPKVQ